MITCLRCGSKHPGRDNGHWEEGWAAPFNLWEPVCPVCYDELLKVRKKIKDFELEKMREYLYHRTAPKEMKP